VDKVLKSGKWQKYKYAVAALIAIMVFCAFIVSLVAVTLSASAPATNALGNVNITNYIPPQPNSTNPVLISFSTGSFRIETGEGYLNITNTGDQNLTLTLTMSAIITAYNTQHTDYSLGSILIPNVIVNAHGSKIIPATLNDTAPIVDWTEKPSGYWGYSWSVQASITTNYLFWHPEVSYKTFDFNGSAIMF
jgi:hypothetical protein